MMIQERDTPAERIARCERRIANIKKNMKYITDETVRRTAKNTIKYHQSEIDMIKGKGA